MPEDINTEMTEKEFASGTPEADSTEPDGKLDTEVKAGERPYLRKKGAKNKVVLDRITAKTEAGDAATTQKKAGEACADMSKSKHAYMYLGPNLPGGILFNGSVYKELPEHLANVFEKLPEIKGLFVEIQEAAETKRELVRRGSEEARLHHNIVALLKEGVLKDGRI